MTSSKEAVCGPCDFRHERKSAMKWCTDCDEAFCFSCNEHHASAKMSRNHDIIDIEDYYRIAQVVEFSNYEICKVHNKTLDFFCPSHNEVSCIVCIQSNHSKCKKWMPLKEAAYGVKSSVALSNLEDNLSKTIDNVESIIKYHNEQKAIHESEKHKLKFEIIQNLKLIIDKIKQLEMECFEKLENEHAIVTQKYHCKKVDMENILRDITRIKDNFDCLKASGTDLQVFLYLPRFAQKLTTYTDSIQSIAKHLETTSYEFKFNPNFQTLLQVIKELSSLGEMSVKKEAMQYTWESKGIPSIPFIDEKNKSIQKMGIQSTSEFLACNDIFPNKKIEIFCCIMLQNKEIIFNEFGSNKLLVYRLDGSHCSSIQLSASSKYLTVINLDNIGISCCNHTVVLYNLRTRVIYKTINVLDDCYAIACHKNKIFVDTYGILLCIDLSGRLVKKIHLNTPRFRSLSVDDTNIYFADLEKNVVYCCDMNGKEIWSHRNEKMVMPIGIAINAARNVFVACEASNNVLLISPDGKQSVELLTEKDGIFKPSCLSFEKTNNCLLVCSGKTGKVVICSL